MRRSALLILATAISFCAQAQYEYWFGIDTITFEDESPYIRMDTSATNIWQVAPPQKEFLNQAYSPVNVMITDSITAYPQGVHSYFDLILTPENTFDFPEALFLRFRHKYCTDEGLDGGYITYSCDMGESWLNIISEEPCHWWDATPAWSQGSNGMYISSDTLYNGEPGYSGCIDEWSEVYVAFHYMAIAPPKSDLNETDTMLVRFNFISDSVDTPFDGWMIDDIETFAADIWSNTEFQEKAEFSLYPNPSNGDLNIQLDDFHNELEVSIYNAVGAQVLEESKVGGENLILTLEQIPDGLYFVHVTSENRSLGVQKVVVGR